MEQQLLPEPREDELSSSLEVMSLDGFQEEQTVLLLQVASCMATRMCMLEALPTSVILLAEIMLEEMFITKIIILMV